MKKTEDIVDRLVALDRALVAKGFPALTPWWLDVLTAFLRSGKKQAVLRVGRRGGKSTSIVRALVAIALYGDHKIPPGDLGVVAIVSVSRDEASQRLRLVKAILAALDIPWSPIDGGIELERKPIAFKIFAASLAGVSGFTCIGAIADETSKWRDEATGANPATEVLSSLRPTMAGQPGARIFLSSSPLGSFDAHAVAFDAGESDFQSVFFAPTWIARPDISEAETHGYEPNPRAWAREFACIPAGESAAILSLDDIDAARCSRPDNVAVASAWPWTMTIDASRGTDAFAWLASRWVLEEEQLPESSLGKPPSGSAWCMGVAPKVERSWNANEGRWEDHWFRQDVRGNWWPTERAEMFERRLVLEVGEVGEVPDARNAAEACDHLAYQARRFRDEAGEPIRRVFLDQFEVSALSSMLRAVGLTPEEMTWSARSKSRAGDRMERLFRERAIRIPLHEPLRRQLAEYSERITRTGSLVLQGSGKHDDFAQVVLTMCMADVEGRLPGSPNWRPNYRHEIVPGGYRDTY